MHLFDSYILIAESSGGSDDPDATENLLIAIASNILEKLPKNFDIEMATEKYPVLYTESMNTVLVQEMERFNILLSIIRKSLQDLIKAIKGAIVMTSELETMAISLSVAKYPAFWSKFSYPSLKSLGGYITNFIERLDFLQVSHCSNMSVCTLIS
jgi:dynein heavy chain